jgi:hypothetical protein
VDTQELLATVEFLVTVVSQGLLAILVWELLVYLVILVQPVKLLLLATPDIQELQVIAVNLVLLDIVENQVFLDRLVKVELVAIRESLVLQVILDKVALLDILDEVVLVVIVASPECQVILV